MTDIIARLEAAGESGRARKLEAYRDPNRQHDPVDVWCFRTLSLAGLDMSAFKKSGGKAGRTRGYRTAAMYKALGIPKRTSAAVDSGEENER